MTNDESNKVKFFFKRSESEPIRESHFRWFYILWTGERELYIKRYAWGVTQENEVHKVSLPQAKQKELTSFIEQRFRQQDVKLLHKNDQQDLLHYRYHLIWMKDNDIFEHIIYGSQLTILEKYQDYQDLWRLCMDMIYLHPNRIPPSIPEVGRMLLELIVEETQDKNRRRKKKKQYLINANHLHITTESFQNRKVDRQQIHIDLNQRQINCLACVFREEWPIIDTYRATPSESFGLMDSWIQVKLKVTIDDLSVVKVLNGRRSKLNEHLGFLAFEIFVKHIDSLV